MRRSHAASFSNGFVNGPLIAVSCKHAHSAYKLLGGFVADYADNEFMEGRLIAERPLILFKLF
jgi:hypothetical protein